MLMCQNHDNHYTTSLFDNLHPNDRDDFFQVLPQMLKDCQQEVVTNWMSQSVAANTIVLGGVSGSGKIWTSMVVLAAYIFRHRPYSSMHDVVKN